MYAIHEHASEQNFVLASKNKIAKRHKEILNLPTYAAHKAYIAIKKITIANVLKSTYVNLFSCSFLS